ncbi:MAG: hypothetical protein DMD67_10735 [Gemmatimonadetes bacterium]|nr:MAG: hypothetical protein DMD67_10735 [Gemmatimonadota bacterium]
MSSSKAAWSPAPACWCTPARRGWGSRPFRSPRSAARVSRQRPALPRSSPPSRPPGSTVDIVLDPIGAATLGGDLRVLRVGGRIVILSTMSGSRTELDLGLLMKKRARVVGSTLRARSRQEKAAIVTRFREEMLPRFATGKLKVTVDSVFPVERAAEAFQRMRENRNVGKVLIGWSGG